MNYYGYFFRVPKNSEVTFKFVLVKSGNNIVVDTENIAARVIVTGDQQALVETTYNCSSIIEHSQDGNIILLMWIIQVYTDNRTCTDVALAHKRW